MLQILGVSFIAFIHEWGPQILRNNEGSGMVTNASPNTEQDMGNTSLRDTNYHLQWIIPAPFHWAEQFTTRITCETLMVLIVSPYERSGMTLKVHPWSHELLVSSCVVATSWVCASLELYWIWVIELWQCSQKPFSASPPIPHGQNLLTFHETMVKPWRVQHSYIDHDLVCSLW
jgi:hypothetical protein